MASTRERLEAVVQVLRLRIPQLQVEYFPEQPDEYRLNHPVGALLVSYVGSRFQGSIDSWHVAQPQEFRMTVTVVMRQLNGKGGALDALDALRAVLVGFKPPDCQPLIAVQESFLGQMKGLWQYALDLQTDCMLVEVGEESTAPLLTQVDYEDKS